MIVKSLLRGHWSLLFMLLSSFSALATDEIPCLVFSGKSGQSRNLDLSVYNRIYFSDTSFKAASSTDSKVPHVELLYSIFNHIELKSSIPSENGGICNLETVFDSKLLYISESKVLCIESSEKNFSVGVFNLSGILVFSSKLNPDNTISIESLPKGSYIAVATNGENNLTLKFIKQ